MFVAWMQARCAGIRGCSNKPRIPLRVIRATVLDWNDVKGRLYSTAVYERTHMAE